MTSLRRLGRLVRYALVFELHIYTSLLRLLLRRPSIPAGTTPIGYARLVTPVLAMWIFGSAVEIPVAHLILPWDGLRLAVLVLGVWGLLWMVGFLAGLRSYPHLLAAHELRVRSGPMHDIAVPLAAVAGASSREQTLPSSLWTLQSEPDDAGVHLHVTVSGEVNVHLALRQPLEVATRKGLMTVTAISFWADDPRQVVARLRSTGTMDAGRQQQRSS